MGLSPPGKRGIYGGLKVALHDEEVASDRVIIIKGKYALAG
jgi:hypothetical protein